MSLHPYRLILLVFSLVVLVFATARAQPAPDAEAPKRQGRMSQAEVQRLFDAYTLKHAQEALELSDAQYEAFQPRMRALQETRRRNQAERLRKLRALSSAVSGGREPAMREHLQALADHDLRAAAELQQAHAAIDAVLELSQQARFRLFEETMERRKFELLMRARQGRGATPPQRRRPS
jgi:ketosteroid isomerase-like protein